MHYLDRFTKYVGSFAAFILVVLVLLVVYDASARYIFSSGSIALQEFEWHLFDVVILFGISYTLRENSHVRVDIFYASFSERTKKIIHFVTIIFFIVPFSSLIIYIGLEFVQLSFSQHEISSNPGGLEYRYLVKALMPLSFLFVVLQAVSELRIK